MNDAEFQVMIDAGDALRAARLLRFLERNKSRGERPTKSDKARVVWLARQLLASRRGAQTLAMRDAIGPEPEVGDHRPTSFSAEQALYREYTRYSGADSPKGHADWVDSVLAVLQEIFSEKSWEELKGDEKAAVVEKLEPLLRRMAEATDRVEPAREHQFHVV